MHDATVVASLHDALQNVADESVRSALRAGIDNAVQALKSRGSAYATKIGLE
ncbi:MAG TPA: hypothetical protein VKA07_05290 [Candidatus Sulfotelmatobacter sp.]|nr:hypothetical protein [Candidatus Sulfotelmatobacter sp.]